MVDFRDVGKLPKPRIAHENQQYPPPCVVPADDEMKFLVLRFDKFGDKAKMYDLVDTQHEAAWVVERASGNNKREWIDVLWVPESAVRTEDVLWYDNDGD